MGKIKDLKGQRFGKLVAIEPTERRVNRCVVWKCQCDCGNICEIKSNNLLTGHTTSCGCKSKENMRKLGQKQQIIDEVGNTYGKLTVLSMNRIDNHCALWNCQCECGNQVIVSGNHLRTGHTTSCGCVKSLGEMKINRILSQSKINFSTQYTVFINQAYYRFDYAIFDENNNLIRLVEFDGEQHFNVRSNWYKNTHNNDILKNNYCKQNNIPLVRIPYWERDSLTLDLILGNKYLLYN